jgi:CPA2 family monovalent cation:H+ antiporter-2
MAGMSPALGSFVAGLLLAESPFAIQVRADVSALRTLLLTLFFTAMGMLADPVWIAQNALLVAGVVALVLVGKALVAFAALRLVRTRAHTAAAAALCLSQVGEFSFVLADLARGSLLSQDTFLLVVSVIVITMILTPYLVALAPTLALRVAGGKPRLDGSAPVAEPATIVVGFGPAGRAASARISDTGEPVIVVEQNPAAAAEARTLGFGVVVGDALQAEVLDHAGLAKARAVVITVPSAEAALSLVSLVRQQVPSIPVLVRARFHNSLAALKKAGAQVIIDEEYEVGRQIARAYRETVLHADDTGDAADPDESSLAD